MVALADLMVAFTALVDAHAPRLAACLGDPHELVRRQALALMASLLSRARAHPAQCACERLAARRRCSPRAERAGRHLRSHRSASSRKSEVLLHMACGLCSHMRSMHSV